MIRIFALLGLFATHHLPANQKDEFAAEREALVKSIREQGVTSEPVLSALRKVQRHLFVPENLRANAYGDNPLPIGLGQTISQPYIVGYMSEILNVSKTHKVLEIGTGSGYQAAVLALIAGQVYSIELEPELAKTAATRLRNLGYANVTVRQGDGYQGWAEHAPYDRIIVTAAPPSIPQPLLDQLKPGGRLVAPVGTSDQWIHVIDKAKDGSIKRNTALPVRFVPMRKAAGQ
jgi:protein-L-isoaspartate(D-aspartate) O-methyltransferase